MARTMTDEQEKAQRYDASKFGEEVQRLWIAELDAERAAHEETNKKLHIVGKAHSLLMHEHDALKARLALAEAALVAWMDSDHRRDKLTAAWRAAK